MSRVPSPPGDDFARGHALHLEGKLEEALLAFLQSAAHGDPRAPRAVAVVAAALGRPREALKALRGSDPADADVLAMMAGLHLDLGEFHEALAACDRALALQGNHRDALMNRGMALRGLGNVAGTLDNDRRLARSYIGSLGAQLNYADACLGANLYEEALAASDRALKLDPRAVTGRLMRGVALAMLDRFAAADADFASAQAMDPAGCLEFLDRAAGLAGARPDEGSLDAESIYFSRYLNRLYGGDWQVRPRLLEKLRQELDKEPQAILGSPDIVFQSLILPISAAEQQRVAQAVARSIVVRAPSPATPLEVERHGRLRVGYLSADFRQHPVAECLWRVFPLHDRDRFEVFAYALTADDGSALRARITADAEHFVDLSTFTDQQIVDRVRADRVNVLVDCSGYTEHTKPQILASRLAPVQAQILGAPGPCGGDFIDYRITDAFATPPEVAEHWDEALAWLPDTLFLCDDTLTVPPPPGRAECGLPEKAFVFCCFNNHYKIEPDVFGIWMRLLNLVPGSVLWLVEGAAETMDRLRSEARQRGIEPARLVFAPRLPLPQHLARHACADLFLDTLYYNAGTTAVYALRAGLPVLTCAGQTTVARMGGSVVRAAGLPELVVTTPGEYETLALRLAVYPGLLDGLRERLRQEGPRSALFDMPERVRALERLYETMWERAERGQSPQAITLPPSCIAASPDAT